MPLDVVIDEYGIRVDFGTQLQKFVEFGIHPLEFCRGHAMSFRPMRSSTTVPHKVFKLVPVSNARFESHVEAKGAIVNDANV